MRNSLHGLWLLMLASLFALSLLSACGSDDSETTTDGDTADQADNADQNEQEAESETEAKIPTLFNVGYAEVDITPPDGTVLGAFGMPGGSRKSKGVHDAIRGQVMVFANDADQAFILIAMDLAGFFYEYGDWNVNGDAPAVREVRQDIAAAIKDSLKIAPQQIVITSSHSHSTPDLIGFFQKVDHGPDKEYLRAVRDKLVTAAKEAVAGLVEAEVYFGKTELVGMTGRDSDCSPIIDNSVNIIQAKKKSDHSVIFTAVNYAKHPTSQGAGNREISADFIWGYREEIEKNVGGKAIYMQGPEAALHGEPGVTIEGDGFDKTYNIGKKLAETVQGALASLTLATDYSILHRWGTTSCIADGGFMVLAVNYFKVPKRTMEPIYPDGDYEIDPDADPNADPVPAAFKIAELEVSWHKLGPSEFIIFPGEATPDFGVKAKNLMVMENKFAIALGNDSLGYIVDAESLAADTSGQLMGYEIPMGMGTGGGPCVWDAITALDWFNGAAIPTTPAAAR